MILLEVETIKIVEADAVVNSWNPTVNNATQNSNFRIGFWYMV